MGLSILRADSGEMCLLGIVPGPALIVHAGRCALLPWPEKQRPGEGGAPMASPLPQLKIEMRGIQIGGIGLGRTALRLQWLPTHMATIPPLPADDPIVQRLEDQLDWYDKKSRAARNAFKRIKVVEIISAAVIPFLTGQPWPGVTYVIGGLGVLITVLEGLLHLNQYQENWSNYRNTAEALKHEKYLFLAKAGPYANAADLRGTLAERIEALMSRENSQWVATVQKSSQASAAK